MILARVALGLSALAFVGYGLQCLFQPEVITANAGLGLPTAGATTEVRAMYGGLQLGLGVLFGMALFRERLRETGLVVMVVVFVSLAAARAMGLALDGADGVYNPAALGFEAVSATLAVLALQRVRAASAGTGAEAPAP